MAYQLDPYEDEEEKKKEGQVGPEQVVAAPSAVVSPGNASSAPKQDNDQRSSGAWTNLQSYVDANRGNDGAMGQRVQQGVEQRATGLTQQAEQYKQGAEGAIQQGTVKDGGVIGALKGAPKAVDKQQFQTQYNATYQGPNAYTDYNGQQAGQIATGTKRLESQVKASDTHEGRTDLLGEVYARPSYTGGEKNLDSYILNAGEQGNQALGTLRGQYGNYGDTWKGITDYLQGQIKQGQDTTQQTRDTTRQAYGSAVQGVEGRIGAAQQRLTDRNKQYDAQEQALRSGLASGDATALSQVGLDPATAAWLKGQGYDTAGHVVKGTTRQSLGDVVGQDGDDYSALLGLLDQSNTKYTDLANKAGGVDRAFDIDAGQVLAANQAAGLRKSLQERLAEKQAAREAEAAKLLQGVGGRNPDQALFDKLGISRDDYRAMGDDRDFAKLVKKGSALQLGDVTTDAERGQWGDLLAQLGIGGDLDVQDRQDEGDSVAFDRGGFQSLVEQGRAREAQWAAERKAAADEADRQMREQEEREAARVRDERQGADRAGTSDSGGGGFFRALFSDATTKKDVSPISDDEITQFLNALKRK